MKAFLSAVSISTIYRASRPGEEVEPLAVIICLVFGAGLIALGLWDWRHAMRGGMGRPLRRSAWAYLRFGLLTALGVLVIVLSLMPLVGL